MHAHACNAPPGAIIDLDAGNVVCEQCKVVLCKVSNKNCDTLCRHHQCKRPSSPPASGRGKQARAPQPNIKTSLMKAGARATDSSKEMAGATPPMVQCQGCRKLHVSIPGDAVGEVVEVRTDRLFQEPYACHANGEPVVQVRPHDGLLEELRSIGHVVSRDAIVELESTYRTRGAAYSPTCRGKTWVYRESSNVVTVCQLCRAIPDMPAVLRTILRGDGASALSPLMGGSTPYLCPGRHSKGTPIRYL